MKRFRMESQMVASGIRNRFKADMYNPTSYSNVLILTYKLCRRRQGPNQDLIQQLANWLEVGASRRGLEKLCVEAIYRDRRNRIRKSIQAVLATQNQIEDSRNSDDDEKAEQIRLVYQEIALPAKLFAVSLGVADAIAAKQDRATKSLALSERFNQQAKNQHFNIPCTPNIMVQHTNDYNNETMVVTSLERHSTINYY